MCAQIYHSCVIAIGVRRFRVVVRSLAAFLSVQVQSETELRLQPTAELQLSAKAQQVGNMNNFSLVVHL